MGRGIEVDTIDDALKQRVFIYDSPHVSGHTLADRVRELANDRLGGLLRVVRNQR